MVQPNIIPANRFTDWLKGEAEQFVDQASQLPLPLGGQTFMDMFGADPANKYPGGPGSVTDFAEMFKNPSGPGPRALIPFTEGNPIQLDEFGDNLGQFFGFLESLRQRSLEADRKIASRNDTPEEKRVEQGGPSEAALSHTLGQQQLNDPAYAWIQGLPDDKRRMAGRNATGAAAVVLNNSGLQASDAVRKQFIKEAPRVLQGFKEGRRLDDGRNNASLHLAVLSDFLNTLVQQEQQVTPDADGNMPLVAPDGSTVPGWNPNNPDTWKPGASGQDQIAVRKGFSSQPSFDTPEQAAQAYDSGMVQAGLDPSLSDNPLGAGKIGLTGLLSLVNPGLAANALLGNKMKNNWADEHMQNLVSGQTEGNPLLNFIAMLGR